MEIDPVYNSETMSDILVSDTSDDDLKRASDDTNPAQARANTVTSRLLHHQPSAHNTLNMSNVEWMPVSRLYAWLVHSAGKA